MSLPPSSQLVRNLAQNPFMQRYLDALYLNHGYYFFAPDPGDGHLIYYDLFDDQGAVMKQGKFPDWELHWPRLWYHRYFMLAEQAGSGYQDEQGQRRYLESYARQLLRQFGGESARVRWIAHQPLDPFSATEPLRLDAPESYKLRLEVVQRRGDLGANAGRPGQGAPDRAPEVANRWIGVPR
jgi:hypothetical protein